RASRTNPATLVEIGTVFAPIQVGPVARVFVVVTATRGSRVRGRALRPGPVAGHHATATPPLAAQDGFNAKKGLGARRPRAPRDELPSDVTAQGVLPPSEPREQCGATFAV